MAEQLGVSGNLDMLGSLVPRIQGTRPRKFNLKVNESEVRQRRESRCLRPMVGFERPIVAVDSEH